MTSLGADTNKTSVCSAVSERERWQATCSSDPPAPPSATPISEFEETRAAYVRYLFYDDGEFRQEESLTSVRRPIPDDAVTVSTGIHFLTPRQESRLHDGVPPKVLQDECNDDGRVAYAIVAESDALEDGEEVQTIIDWLSTFAEDWLDIDEYSLYFSGNRSIHLHTKKFVPANEIDDLRRLAEEFNDIHDADLDTGIYKQNSQFRLVGAEHRKTGLYKTPIGPDADRTDCIRTAQRPPHRKEWPFELPSPDHHSNRTLGQLEPKSPQIQPQLTHYRPGFAGSSSLPAEFEGEVMQGVYKRSRPGSVGSGQDHTEYATPFSPYKKTGDADCRSVIVMEQTDGIRQDRRSREIYVPAQIKYAIGGGDGSHIRAESKSLVTLSPRDYRKWGFDTGDYVVIIGGNSGSSRLFGVGELLARLVALTLENDGREEALEILSDQEYDVGSSGYNSSKYHDESGTNDESEAAKVKRGIEEGTHERTYENILKVACRLLRTEGWDAAHGWCEDIFGRDFDPEETHERLAGIVETYDDYAHVNIPENPGRTS